ncbi:MAG: hypothetical protein ABR508_06890 [Candidatus Baltobacteraceae bacterium]
MEFDLLDGYLLDGKPAKAALIEALLESPPALPQAGPFLEGMRILKARTPDLSLLALRLILAGKPANDETVLALRTASDAARANGAGRPAAVERYRSLTSS